MLGNSQQTDPGKGFMDITVQIFKKCCYNIVTSDTHSTVSTLQVMSQERGKEKQEAKFKFLPPLNVVN